MTESIDYLNIIAIIPARGGSKGIPGKNIKNFEGKPLISHSIEYAQDGKLINEIYVSTDDEQIAHISKTAGAKIIKRPLELATDTSTTESAIKHALNNIDNLPDIIVLLQPTSPLRTVNDIDEAIEELYLKSADSIVSVSECEHNPLWSNTLPENNSMKHFIKEGKENIRSQYLEKHYRLNGAIYAVNTSFFKSSQNFFGDNTFAYHMPAEKSIDIDTLSDFICAEAIMTYNISKKK